MGSCLNKPEVDLTPQQREDLRVRTIFERFDKDKTGFISKENLISMVKGGDIGINDVDHILQKFGEDNKLTYDQFKYWWSSTYTTYNDDGLRQVLDELDEEGQEQQQQQPALGTIEEENDAERKKTDGDGLAVNRS